MAFVCDIGDIAYIQNIFANSSGVAVDPTTVTLYLADPSGSVGTYTYAAGNIIKLATGTYYYNGTITQSGYWNARWEGAGAAVAASQGRFFARETNT